MFNKKLKRSIKEIGNEVIALRITTETIQTIYEATASTIEKMKEKLEKFDMDEILKGHKEALGKHAGRLKRQGADIYELYKLFEKLRKEMLDRRINEERFSKRLKEEESWTEALKKGIALSAECSGKLLNKHNKRLDEQGKGIDELQDRSIEQRKEIQKLSKNEMVGSEDINRTAEDLKETRDVVMELAEHLGFEITTERNKDHMKAYKVVIKKKEAKK